MRSDEVDPDEFEKLVTDELDLLPDEMMNGIENVGFVTQSRPDDGSLRLLGLYTGIALTRRGQYGHGELPDRIVLYREPLLRISRDIQDLHNNIHVTLVHEIGHYYGLDDAELKRLGWG
ncbi:MAG TPA: metallopeptidase family protein [Galbitalea sp.]|jgi:predicted Zn-dependent protease with MMP-like domain|nr:metallopeptidase family protein [Galbitalea sp.]